MNDRIPAERATRNVTALLRKLYPEFARAQELEPELAHELDPGIEYVGSLRRGATDVHDVDLLAPLPVTGQDELYTRLAALYGDKKVDAKAGIFAKEPENKKEGGVWGRVEKGLAEGFKCFTLIMPLPGRANHPDGPGWQEPFDLKVEIHRYTPGPGGNKGWIQMIKTGPGGKTDQEIGWGEMMLIRWKQRNEGGRSYEGYPCRGNGERVAVPDEETAFRLCGFEGVVPPHLRTVVWAGQLAKARVMA